MVTPPALVWPVRRKAGFEVAVDLQCRQYPSHRFQVESYSVPQHVFIWANWQTHLYGSVSWLSQSKRVEELYKLACRQNYTFKQPLITGNLEHTGPFLASHGLAQSDTHTHTHTDMSTNTVVSSKCHTTRVHSIPQHYSTGKIGTRHMICNIHRPFAQSITHHT